MSSCFTIKVRSHKALALASNLHGFSNVNSDHPHRALPTFSLHLQWGLHPEMYPGLGLICVENKPFMCCLRHLYSVQATAYYKVLNGVLPLHKVCM